MTPPSSLANVRSRTRLPALAIVTLVLGLLALAAPPGGAEYPASRVGALLAIAGAIEALHSLRRSTAASRRQATISAIISIAIAVFLIGAPFVAAQSLRFLIAGWFAIDVVRFLLMLVRGRERDEQATPVLALLGNLTVVLLVVFARGWPLRWVVPIAGALRILGIGWNIATAPVHTTRDAEDTVLDQLGLADQPGAAAMATEVAAAEQLRAPIDRAWTLSYITTLFAIHIGRMSIDLTLLGLSLRG